MPKIKMEFTQEQQRINTRIKRTEEWIQRLLKESKSGTFKNDDQ